MDDHAKMERLLRLLIMLSGNRTYTRKQLAEHLEMDVRSISRYIQTFNSAGFLVESTRAGYRLYADKPQNLALLQNLYFSEEELYLLHHAIQSVSLAGKPAQKLKQKLHLLYHYQALAQSAEKLDAAKIKTISEAVDRKKCVCLHRYRSGNSKTIKDRLVEPFAFHDDFSGVWCWERESSSNKVFLFSRMEGITVSQERWLFEKNHGISFVDAFGLAAPKPVANVKALLSLKAYNLLTEEYPLADKHLKADESIYHLQIPVAGFQGIARFVLGLPGEVKVLGPKKFVDYLEKERKKFERMTEVDKG